MKIQFKFSYKETEDYKTWISFYPRKSDFGFRLTMSSYGYFDPRPQFVTNITTLIAITLPFISLYLIPISILFLFFGWGSIFLNIPINTGKYGKSTNPEYGILFYDINLGIPTEIWIKYGRKLKIFNTPWCLEWHRNSFLLKNGNWESEFKGNRKNFHNKKWGNIWNQEYDYTYITKSGVKQFRKAKISVKEIEWRRNWLRFTRLFSVVNRYIEVDFNKEIGEKVGTYKGGVVSCSMKMMKNETPFQTLKRMERDRQFN